MVVAQLFAFDETARFEQNMATFAVELSQLEAQAGPVLVAALAGLADEEQDKPTLLNQMFLAIGTANLQQGAAGGAPQAVPPPAAAPAADVAPVRWFLEGIEIEGFRGINNEGSPLKLKFKPDCVSSISAPNGVGKSSIYDALSFALRGKIPKLDRLQQAERPQEYYNNRFHPSGTGTIKLTLRPDNGVNSVSVTVTRTATGMRNVTGPRGIDANVLLTSLNREFVLLDAQTFSSFIDNKALALQLRSGFKVRLPCFGLVGTSP